MADNTPNESGGGVGWVQSHHFETSTEDQLSDSDPNDHIASLAFSQNGDHIAVGDRGGRVWIYSTPKGRAFVKPMPHYERVEENLDAETRDSRTYDFYGQFQSHEPGFDSLKSLDIEERINDIVWCPRTNNSLRILTTNDKTIKLWDILEKPDYNPSASAVELYEDQGLQIPKMVHTETITAAVLRRMYDKMHTYHIHSISTSTDNELFLSCDDLRMNLWHVDSPAACYPLIDLKPEDMNDLTEVITCAQYHPTHCSLLSYSSSNGYTYIVDLRTKAKDVPPCKVFGQRIEESQKSFFSEILVSVADMDFSKDDAKLFTRDYLSIRVWDMRMEKEPFKIIPLQTQLDSRLCELYENDCIFDKFQLRVSGDYCVTGSYGNTFKIVNWKEETVRTTSLNEYAKTEDNMTEDDFRDKSLFAAWHADGDCFAVTANAGLYIYQRDQSTPRDVL